MPNRILTYELKIDAYGTHTISHIGNTFLTPKYEHIALRWPNYFACSTLKPTKSDIAYWW